jgi:hypothetical protein
MAAVVQVEELDRLVPGHAVALAAHAKGSRKAQALRMRHIRLMMRLIRSLHPFFPIAHLSRAEASAP